MQQRRHLKRGCNFCLGDGEKVVVLEAGGGPQQLAGVDVRPGTGAHEVLLLLLAELLVQAVQPDAIEALHVAQEVCPAPHRVLQHQE